jgi:hypothetical protein
VDANLTKESENDSMPNNRSKWHSIYPALVVYPFAGRPAPRSNVLGVNLAQSFS